MTKNSAATVKTILLHVQDGEFLDQRVESALSLARACSAHLTCLHVTPVQAYVAFDGFGGLFVMNDVMKALDEQEARLRERVERQMANEDVSWDYTHCTGEVAPQIIRYAALADLVVTGREPHRVDFVGPAIGLLGDLLHRSRTPLFIPASEGAIADPAGPAIIAWDGSYEACNAVRGAVGLLKIAAEVRIVQVRESGKDEAFPNTRLVQYLSRHGIHAELQLEQPALDEDDGITEVLLSQAETSGAAYIVMGGYNHSRIGQYLFGGVTRKLLSQAPVPLLMSH